MKRKKKSIASLSITATMLAMMLTVGSSNVYAKVCGDTDFDCNTPATTPPGISTGTDVVCDCGDTVVGSTGYIYHLTNSLICSTQHGLIIGSPDIGIDGKDLRTGVLHKIDGSGTPIANRNCEVLTADEGVPERQWCVDHPCRHALVGGGALDSGILNALPLAPVPDTPLYTYYCNRSAPAGQGGCDGILIRNVEITGWCDGIWVSGDCSTGAGHTRLPAADYGNDDEYRLTGLIIEGNYIHDNGNPDCGDYTPNTNPDDPDDGGDWENNYYNDAIFTAQIGLDSKNSTVWQVANGIPAYCDERTFFDPRLCDPSSDPITQHYCYFWDGVTDVNMNKIVGNKIVNQKGCGCVSCAGGMGINLQGGLEIEAVLWSGANQVGDNVVENCAMSGITHSHATRHNRIHANICTGNGYGGITGGCGWNHDNYIFDNCVPDNYGMGIGVASESIIANNRAVRTREVTNSELLELLWVNPGDRYGILIGGDAYDSLVVGNTACGNDIDISPVYEANDNMCDTLVSNCEYSCWDNPLFEINLCKGDLDGDCKVNTLDLNILYGQWMWGVFPNPSCCP